MSWFPRGNDPSLNNRAGGEILSEISRGNRSPPSVFNYERRRRRRRRNASRSFSLPRLSTLERKRKREREFFITLVPNSSNGAPFHEELLSRSVLAEPRFFFTAGDTVSPREFLGWADEIRQEARSWPTWGRGWWPPRGGIARVITRSRFPLSGSSLRETMFGTFWRFILPHLSCRRIGVSCAQGMRGEEERKSERESLDKCGLA